MDYAYFGPASEWPMASTIASATGIALMFGQQIGQGVSTIAGLAANDLRRRLDWIIRPWLACLAMLMITLAFPKADWVTSLRGVARIDSEIEVARADGYYEELIRSSPDRRKPNLARRPPDRKPFTDSGLVDEVPDYRRRVIRPNLDARWNGTTFRTNSLGYRGPEISRGKPPGTFRVVVLGSSNTLGHGVDDHEGYVRLLERGLADLAGPGRSVEVVNLAVSGDSPTQRWLRLRDEASKLEPDWLLVDVTALDFSLEEQHLRWAVDKRVDVPFDPAREALAGSGVRATDSPDQFHKKLSPSLKSLLDQTMKGWAAEARKLQVPLTVVILPRADSKAESPKLFHLFRDLAGRHGLRSVDLSHTFDRLELDDYRIAPWDHHPNALGHRLIFARLRDELLDDEDFEARLEGTGGAGD